MADRKTPKNTYLEYIAGFASPVSGSQENQKTLISRLVRYYQQSLARELLPAEKVAKCARTIRPNKQVVEVVHVPDGNKAYFRNLVICGRVWTCPVCAAKVNERRRAELAMLIYQSGYRPILVTYTLQHQRRDRLITLVDAMRVAMRRLKSGKGYQTQEALYGIVGTVRGMEVTYGRSGWHPHDHEIVMMSGGTTDEQVDAFETWLRDHWQQALKVSERRADWSLGVTVTKHDGDIAGYIAKFGHEPSRQGWTITHELVKSNQKHAGADGKTPFDLLISYGNGNLADGRKFQEYARVTKNIHPLHWSKGLRALLLASMPEQSDDELAAGDPDEFVIMANLDPSAWRVILAHDKRGALLNVASSGNKAAVIAWLTKNGITHVDLNDLI